MPALRKPHRIGVLAPICGLHGADGANEREARVLLWVAVIEACQRHPGLAVYDAESTPLVPVDGHFAPQHAAQGATPTDAFWGTTRRDELVWLELELSKPAGLRLHSLAFAGTRQIFEAPATMPLGDQIQHVITAWLLARELPALPRRFEAITGEAVLAVVRALAPVLAEHARAWTPPASLAAWAGDAALLDDLPADDSAGPEQAADADRDAATIDVDVEGDAGTGPEATSEHTLEPPGVRSTTARLARATANRLPPGLRVAALRVLELALHEPLGDLLLAADLEHPQALFARFLGKLGRQRDFVLLRRVIAAAPGWARPYTELAYGTDLDEQNDDDDDPAAPSELETVAGTGIAALCRPGHFEVIERASAHLRADGRPDEALRLLERGVRIHDREARAHLALLVAHPAAKRPGTWLAQAQRSARTHGCPMDAFLPWYPDQIQIDLHVADALLAVGRLDEAIALRANRLEGREAEWPRHARILTSWRGDPRIVATAFAREAHFRGDPARVLEGLGHAEPRDSFEVAILVEALVAMGRESEVPHAWARHGIGRGHDGPVARLAAARGLLAAGEWRRGLEELWRVELGEPGRDDHVAVTRCGLLLACMPIEIAETALAERMAAGATGLARRMARDLADFAPAAARSEIVMRALGSTASTAPDAASLAAFPAEPHTRAVVDALFANLAGAEAPQVRADRLVDRWIEVVYADAADDDPARLARAAAYVAAQALSRYLAATTAAPSPIAGALRIVAAEALALVRRHRDWLGDRDARALLGVIEPLLRKVDRWLGMGWLAAVERSCALDERAGGDLGGFVRDHATIVARVLGPEEEAVLAASVARMHRDRERGWESATAAQAMRLALHTGHVGVDELADAVIAQLATAAIDPDDAIDALTTAAYLAEGRSAVPAIHAARVLLDSRKGPAALAVLTPGLAAADDDERAHALDSLRAAWQRELPAVPLDAEAAARAVAEARDRGDLALADQLARWAIALAPGTAAARAELQRAHEREHGARGTTGVSPGAATGVATGESAGSEATSPPADAGAALAFQLLAAGDFATAAVALAGSSWRARRAALAASAFRSSSDNHVEVTPRARAAAASMLVATAGQLDRDAVLCRIAALDLREAAYFARDVRPRLGERLTREAFERELRTRSGTISEAPAVRPVAFVDRVVVPGGKIARASDYVALLHDLAALAPAEALAQFDLDDDAYLEVARTWAAAVDADPSVATLIAAGLAKR